MTFDVKKYPGYTEMIFRNRKSTLTRKKALATFLTNDNLEIQLYDFYNKYHFFMKFDGFDSMINIYDDFLDVQVEFFRKYAEQIQHSPLPDGEAYCFHMRDCVDFAKAYYQAKG